MSQNLRNQQDESLKQTMIQQMWSSSNSRKLQTLHISNNKLIQNANLIPGNSLNPQYINNNNMPATV